MVTSNDSSDAASRLSNVLVVDDDEHLLQALKRGLSLRGFEVAVAQDAGRALPFLQGQWPQVIILDITMPGMDGLSFCQLVREKVSTPILMLTARDSVPDRVAGLEAGADDYLVKPFELEELVARLRALLRRGQHARPEMGAMSYADVTLDPRAWTASRAGQPLQLTAKEFQLLEHFLRTPEQVLARDDIMAAIWGSEWLGTRSNVVDVHLANLRQKLEEGGRSRLIQTVRSVGYMLKEQ
jgi:two-component system, OmpR family, response regulator MprA